MLLTSFRRYVLYLMRLSRWCVLLVVFGLLCGCAGEAIRPVVQTESSADVSDALELKSPVSPEPSTEPTEQPAKPAEQSPSYDSRLFRHYFYDLMVAEMRLQQGDSETAIASYLALSRLLQDEQLARYTTQIALHYGRMEYALDAALNWLEISSDQYEARRTVALLMLFNAEVDESAKHFIELIERHDNEEHAVLEEVIQVFSRDQANPVMLDVVTLLAHHFADSVPLWRLATEASLEKDDHARTATFLKRAIALGAEDFWAEKIRIRLLLATGKKGEATLRYRFLVASAPEDVSLQEGYAEFLKMAGFFIAARDEYASLAIENPENPIYRFWTAIISFALEEHQLALKLFHELYDEDFYVFHDVYREHDVAFYIAQIYEQQSMPHKAIEWYERVTVTDLLVPATVLRVELLHSVGRHDASGQIFYQLRVANPAQAIELYLAEVAILQQVKAYERSFDVINQAMVEYPEENSLLHARAMLHYNVGYIVGAERDLLELIRRDENDGIALNALAYTLAEHTERYDEAYVYIQRAIELLPDEPAVIDSVGWIYYKLGDLVKAEKWLRRAVELMQSAEVIYHLAQVLFEQGLIEESCEMVKLGRNIDNQHVRLFLLEKQCQKDLK